MADSSPFLGKAKQQLVKQLVNGAVLSKEPHLPQAALFPAFTAPGYTRPCCSSGLFSK